MTQKLRIQNESNATSNRNLGDRDKEISKIEHLVAEMEQKVWVPGKVANSELVLVFHILFHFSVRPAGK